jgi:hypothetical protein
MHCGIDPTKSFEQRRDAMPVTVSRDDSARSVWAKYLGYSLQLRQAEMGAKIEIISSVSEKLEFRHPTPR